MPPKRSHDNVDVDVDDEGEGDNIKTIWIVSPNGEQFMCEICSSILKSAESLARHKKSRLVYPNIVRFTT